MNLNEDMSEFSILLTALHALLPGRREENWAPLVIREWIKRCSYILVWALEVRAQALDAAYARE